MTGGLQPYHTRYDLIERIGIGGMAEVYLAMDNATELPVVIKRVTREFRVPGRILPLDPGANPRLVDTIASPAQDPGTSRMTFEHGGALYGRSGRGCLWRDPLRVGWAARDGRPGRPLGTGGRGRSGRRSGRAGRD